MERLSNGTLTGGAIGATTVQLAPHRTVCGRYGADAKTAGSVCLMAQAAVPCLLFASEGAATGQGGGSEAAPSRGETSQHSGGDGVGASNMTARGNGQLVAAPSGTLAPAHQRTEGSSKAVGKGYGPERKRRRGRRGSRGEPGSGGEGPDSGEGAASPAASTSHSATAAQPAGTGEEIAARLSVLTLKGGTDADHAPPIDYFRFVLAPLLQRQLGVAVAFDLARRGFFPRGGGIVSVTVPALPPGASLPPIQLAARGALQRIDVRAFAAGRAPRSTAQRMADAALADLRAAGVAAGAAIEAQVTQETADTAGGDGSGVLLVAETDTGAELHVYVRHFYCGAIQRSKSREWQASGRCRLFLILRPSHASSPALCTSPWPDCTQLYAESC